MDHALPTGRQGGRPAVSVRRPPSPLAFFSTPVQLCMVLRVTRASELHTQPRVGYFSKASGSVLSKIAVAKLSTVLQSGCLCSPIKEVESGSPLSRLQDGHDEEG